VSAISLLLLASAAISPSGSIRSPFLRHTTSRWR
jgi:hypothetical protein